MGDAVVNISECLKLIVMALGLAAPAAHAALAEGELVRLSVSDTAEISKRQVVHLTADEVAEPLLKALAAAGYATEGTREGRTLAVTLLSYDSGKYFGFAKTARITAQFVLTPGPSGVSSTWSADCNFRAPVTIKLESTEVQNATAVKGCLAELAGQLVRTLGAP